MDTLKTIGKIVAVLAVLLVLALAGYAVWGWCHELPGPPNPFHPVPPAPAPGPLPIPPWPPSPGPQPEAWLRATVAEVNDVLEYRLSMDGRDDETIWLVGLIHAKRFDRRGRKAAEELIGGKPVAVRFASKGTGWIRLSDGRDLGAELQKQGWLKPAE